MRSTLYVARVGNTSDLIALEELFVTVADVQSQRLEGIPELSSQPFGIFEMASEQDATACVERFNGHEFEGRRLSIVSERPKARAPLAPPANGKRHAH